MFFNQDCDPIRKDDTHKWDYVRGRDGWVFRQGLLLIVCKKCGTRGWWEPPLNMADTLLRGFVGDGIVGWARLIGEVE